MNGRLALKLKAGESVEIGGSIKVTVYKVGERNVKLAIEAPKEIAVLRSDAKKKEPKTS
jgi:carbon storage regulator